MPWAVGSSTRNRSRGKIKPLLGQDSLKEYLEICEKHKGQHGWGKVKPIDDLLNDWADGFVFAPKLTFPTPEPTEEETSVRVLVAQDESLQPKEKQLIFEQLAPKEVETMVFALEDIHRMKVFMQKSKKYWDDVFLAKDNAASTDPKEEDIHKDVSRLRYRHTSLMILHYVPSSLSANMIKSVSQLQK